MDGTSAITETALWVGFLALTALLLGADMVTSRRLHHATMRLAALHVAAWVAVAAAVGCAVWWLLGGTAASEYSVAYALELSLSVDNVFVFAVVFRAMAVSESAQRRALLWGVLGAFAMRAVCILAGITVLKQYAWTEYVFGAILAVTAVRMVVAPEREPEIASHWSVRLFRRILPLSDAYDGDRFLTRTSLGWRATPLVLVVCVVEVTDLIFAVDSIPAVLGVTGDAFIAFSSNVMAVLGLRALYFVVAGFLSSAASLKYGLALVLFLIGAKFVAEPLSSHFMAEGESLHVPPWLMLGTVAAILLANLAIALAISRRRARASDGASLQD